MFENLNTPTEFDYQLIQLIWRYMTPTERAEFQENINQCFSENDVKAVFELSKTILVVESYENFSDL